MSSPTSAKSRTSPVPAGARRAASWPLALICAAQFVLQLASPARTPAVSGAAPPYHSAVGAIGPEPIDHCPLARCGLGGEVHASGHDTPAERVFAARL
jgi:hypothetical protein